MEQEQLLYLQRRCKVLKAFAPGCLNGLQSFSKMQKHLVSTKNKNLPDVRTIWKALKQINHLYHVERQVPGHGGAKIMNNPLTRTFVKVYFKNQDGIIDEISTYINETPDEAARHYLGNTFNFGTTFDILLTAYHVNCYRTEIWQLEQWHVLNPDVRLSYKIQGGKIIRINI